MKCQKCGYTIIGRTKYANALKVCTRCYYRIKKKNKEK